MGFSILGDFAKLREWQDKTKDSSKLLRTLTKNVGETLVSLVRDGFEGEHDPYGSPWEALKERSGRILQDTGRLRNSWHQSGATNDSVTVSASADYAGYHQNGTSKMPARPMVPREGALPPKWADEVKATAQDVLDDYFNR